MELARLLWDSLDDEVEDDVEAAWDAELTRRFAEIDSGQAVGIPAHEAIERLRQKHR
jgi:putative addiction module component (TIGR02574 family)